MRSHTLRSTFVISLFAAAPGCLGDGVPAEPVNVGVAPQAVAMLRDSLMETVDYSETFTLGGARTDGLYNDNRAGAYGVESSSSRVWTPASHFSFNTPASSTSPALVSAAGGNPGAMTGLAQSGSDDFSFSYNRRASYIVQADAILPADRFDISSHQQDPPAAPALGRSAGRRVSPLRILGHVRERACPRARTAPCRPHRTGANGDLCRFLWP